MTARSYLLLMFLFLLGCGSSTGGDPSPSGTVRAYLAALQAGDQEDARTLVHSLSLAHGKPPIAGYIEHLHARELGYTFTLGPVVTEDHRANVGFQFHRDPPQVRSPLFPHGVIRLYRKPRAGGAWGAWKIRHVELPPGHTAQGWSGEHVIDLPRVSMGCEDTGYLHCHRVYVSARGDVSLQEGVTIDPDALDAFLSVEIPRDADEPEELEEEVLDENAPSRHLTSKPRYLHIHADREVPWSAVRSLIRSAGDTPLGINSVGFAVRGAWPGSLARDIAAVVWPVPTQAGQAFNDGGVRSLRLQIVRSGEGANPKAHTVIRVGDGDEVSLPHGSWPRSSGALLARGREYGRAVRDLRAKIVAHLETVTPGSETRAEIRFADPLSAELPYRDVVHVIDALLGLDIEQIVLVGLLEPK